MNNYYQMYGRIHNYNIPTQIIQIETLNKSNVFSIYLN